ncbi:MAG TPA: peptidoglycan-binding protein [Kofleriaceae bacterium]|nr:peptidoglycan-binding protein [Kofleriaceae bacterium]
MFDHKHRPGKTTLIHDQEAHENVKAGVPGKRTRVEQEFGGMHAAHAHRHEELERASASESSGINMGTLREFISKHEGYVAHVYLDSRGYPSAGIGHLIRDNHHHVGDKVSAEQISEWFKQDVATAIAGAKQDLGPAYERLNEARKIVVIDMVFNLGVGGFAEFRDTIHAIRVGNFARAADEMLDSKWAGQVGARAIEDAAIMRGGHLVSKDGSDGDPITPAPSLQEVGAGHAVLKLNDKGPAVAEIQPLMHLPADGLFGGLTLHAVQRFQRSHSLDVDGIVGRRTLERLAHRPLLHPREGRDGTSGTGGVEVPAEERPFGAGSGTSHGDWSLAPPLEAVKHGAATLHEGQRGPAVRKVQKLLAVEVDGKFGPQTRQAAVDFQRRYREERHDGVIDAHTLSLLVKHPVGSIDGESRRGAAQRHELLGIARQGSEGNPPDGRCYKHVCEFLVECNGYGKIKNPYTDPDFQGYLAEAHNFAGLMHKRTPHHFGLEHVAISSPYNAPLGSIVVVKAGSPGTSHPTAGDISIADGHGNFYNGGEMSYGGPAGWNASDSAKLLGCYVPL